MNPSYNSQNANRGHGQHPLTSNPPDHHEGVVIPLQTWQLRINSQATEPFPEYRDPYIPPEEESGPRRASRIKNHLRTWLRREWKKFLAFAAIVIFVAVGSPLLYLKFKPNPQVITGHSPTQIQTMAQQTVSSSVIWSITSASQVTVTTTMFLSTTVVLSIPTSVYVQKTSSATSSFAMEASKIKSNFSQLATQSTSSETLISPSTISVAPTGST